jgi:hypothetical protein
VAKNSNRGLPPSFNLDIPEPSRDAPVQLGDYLEEVDAAPVVKPAPKPVAKASPPASNVVEMPRPAERPTAEKAPPERKPAETSPEIEPERRAQPVLTEPRPVPRSKKKVPKPPPRKQINATPEALRMIDELIDHVQTYSVQKDAKASEIFHALVLALYEARDHLDLSEVPTRGKWGTPTAQAFPISLKGAFQDAIAQYKRNRK